MDPLATSHIKQFVKSVLRCLIWLADIFQMMIRVFAVSQFYSGEDFFTVVYCFDFKHPDLFQQLFIILLLHCLIKSLIIYIPYQFNFSQVLNMVFQIMENIKSNVLTVLLSSSSYKEHNALAHTYDYFVGDNLYFI